MLTTNKDQYFTDVLVVGSGAGGAVVAKELSEKGIRVLILEEGLANKTQDHNDTPYRAIQRLYRDSGFTTTFGKPFIPVPLGKTLGGTTTINSGTCFRTPATILAKWRNQYKLNIFSEEYFNPIFNKIENELNVTPADYLVMSKSNLMIRDAFAKRNLEGFQLNRNVKKCEGCGYCCYGCPSGAKQSMDQSYIPKAQALGAEIITGFKAQKILVKNHKVLGVVAFSTNRKISIFANKIIIAAGTLLTPILLKKNKLVRFNHHLGKNITIHPATKVFAEFDQLIEGWKGTPQAYYSNLYANDGITFEGIFVPPDIAAITIPFFGPKLVHFMKHYKNITSYGFLIEDSARGSLYTLPGLGTFLSYNLTPEDVKKFKKGISFLIDLYLSEGAKNVFPLVRNYHEIKNSNDLATFLKASIKPEDIECMAFHPLGSARIARNENEGVVDQNLKVFGYDNLYLCDGSVVPSALGVNPQITIMALATHCAQQIAQS